MDRLEFLKRLGALTVGASLLGVNAEAIAAEAEDIPEVAAGEKIDIPIEPLGCTVPKPVKQKTPRKRMLPGRSYVMEFGYQISRAAW